MQTRLIDSVLIDSSGRPVRGDPASNFSTPSTGFDRRFIEYGSLRRFNTNSQNMDIRLRDVPRPPH
jgi:hypothetical protein